MWQKYSPEELKSIIKKEPLTPERIEHVMKYHRVRILFSKEAISSVALDCERDKYLIIINSLDNAEKQKKDLAHKLVHVWYNASMLAVKGTCSKIEGLVVKESERFYNQNKPYIDNLYAKLLKN